jgi:REP element-mobilizing transposase RayT
VGISGGHSDRLVSHQFLHCLQVYPTHHQTASEGVPQGVPGDAFDLSLLKGGGERKQNFAGRSFWTRGFLVSIIGRDEAVVREYIRNQEKEDQRLEQLKMWQ